MACCPGKSLAKGKSASAALYAPYFKALGDSTRLEMLGLLEGNGKELCVCDIESHFRLSQPTVSHHLRLLREAGLICGERRGNWIYYALAPAAFENLAAFWKLMGG